MNKESKKLVIFDFDGVLVDTLLACYSVSKEVNNNMSIEEYKSFFEGNIYDALRSNGEKRKSHPDFVNRYAHETRELKVPFELKYALELLAEKYIFTVVSSTPSSLIEEILRREDLMKYFKEILGSDVHTSKVKKINILLNKYNISPNDSVFVTDTLGDIKEAKECGVKAIAVNWGFHDIKTLKKGNPVKIVKSPKELISAIENVLQF